MTHMTCDAINSNLYMFMNASIYEKDLIISNTIVARTSDKLILAFKILIPHGI